MTTELGASSAQHPDLDWSQIRETVVMLNLAVTLIKSAMKDGDRSVETLIGSFTSMTGGVQIMKVAIEDLEDDASHSLSGLTEIQRATKSTIQQTCQGIHGQMQQSIIAFQFYDQLTQRLSHVSDSLSSLSELVSTPTRLYNPQEWKGLQERIQSQYSVEIEKAMFGDVLRGMSVDQVLDKYHNDTAGSNVVDDHSVEFF